MIEKINVRNIFSFKEVSLDIKPITFLIGFNNSGKTNLFRVITIIKQLMLTKFMFKEISHLNFVFPVPFEDYKEFLDRVCNKFADNDIFDIDIDFFYVPETGTVLEDNPLKIKFTANFKRDYLKCSLDIRKRKNYQNDDKVIPVLTLISNEKYDQFKIQFNLPALNFNMNDHCFNSFSNKLIGDFSHKNEVYLNQCEFEFLKNIFYGGKDNFFLNSRKLVPINLDLAFRIQTLDVCITNPYSNIFNFLPKSVNFFSEPFLEQINLDALFSSLIYNQDLVDQVNEYLKILFPNLSSKLILKLLPKYKIKVNIQENGFEYPLSNIGNGLFKALNYIILFVCYYVKTIVPLCLMNLKIILM